MVVYQEERHNNLSITYWENSENVNKRSNGDKCVM